MRPRRPRMTQQFGRPRRSRSMSSSANERVGYWAANVDDRTGDVARRVSQILVLAVSALRIPTAIVGWLPLPFIASSFLVSLTMDGGGRVLGIVISLAMAIILAAFWGRRQRVLGAVDDPEKLATELGIMISLSEKVDETRGTLEQLAGGGGARVFSRLQGLWHGARMTDRWISGIGDLPRARYFAPPKIGTTITITVAALWLIPISVVVAILTAIAGLAAAI